MNEAVITGMVPLFAPVSRSLRVSALMDGEIRVAKFERREHLILPVVALMEGVVWPFASPTKELVLASEIEAMDVRSWNGRPATLDHPTWDGKLVPANSPEVLDAYQCGRTFNAALKGKKLAMEAWVDIARAEQSREGKSVLRRARAKEPIEVSVGIFMTPENSPGEYDGEEFEIIWRDIVADHLALLPEDAIGACSVEMGCGAPRTARAARVHYFDINPDKVRIEERSMPQEPPTTRSLRERLFDTFGFKTNASDEGDMSQSELARDIERLLYSSEPAFLGVVDIFPASNEVIYAVAPGDKLQTFRRKYNVDGENKVTLTGVRKEVEPVTRYEALEAEEPTAEPQPTNAAGCGCGGSQMNPKTERVQALIDSKKNGFTAAQKSVLESMTDDQLAALEAADAAVPEQAPAADPEPEPAPVPAPAAAAPSTLSEAEWRRVAPPEVLQIIDDKRAQDAREKAETVSALKGKQSVYTEAELNAMPIANLRKIAALAGVQEPSITSVDFSTRGFMRANNGAEPETVPAPPRLMDALSAKK